MLHFVSYTSNDNNCESERIVKVFDSLTDLERFIKNIFESPSNIDHDSVKIRSLNNEQMQDLIAGWL